MGLMAQVGGAGKTRDDAALPKLHNLKPLTSSSFAGDKKLPHAGSASAALPCAERERRGSGRAM